LSAAPGWGEIALRLACTLAAGILIGLNRRGAGQSAGLRTVILVALAASLAMLQASILMPTHGKATDSYVVLDLMRLPLGILSGIGFIGAGAILRRGDAISGVTTAATLWFTTVVGLCFGGGQLALGGAGLALALVTLAGGKHLEHRLREDRRATLRLTLHTDNPTDGEIRDRLKAAGFEVVRWAVDCVRPENERTLECRLRWRGYPGENLPPPLWEELLRDPRLRSLHWEAEQADP
jgi:putative Mg2+ transporter-C (MgtC) family protein